MIKAIKKWVKDKSVFLAVFAIIFTFITLIFQIEFGKILYTLAILTIFVLFWIVLYQHTKIIDLQNKEKDILLTDYWSQLRKYLHICKNPNLKIETIKQTTHVEGVNVRIKREFRGKNISDEHVSFFVAIAGGDRSLVLNRLSFTARDVKRNFLLAVEPIKDWDASVFKILKIMFTEPLEPDEEFEIVTQYNWPGAIGEKDDIIFPVTLYNHVDNVDFKVIFDAESKPDVWEFRGVKTGKIKKATTIDTEYGELKLSYSLKNVGSEDYIFSFHPINNIGTLNKLEEG